MDEFKSNTNFGESQPLPEIIANSIKIEDVLGRGGMGTVYRARHLSLDREVAVKIINPELISNTDITQRFSREARLMAKLRHPRAAMIYDSGTLPDGRLFIVMEYVEGETLAEVLKREGRLPYRRAVEIATSICEVLSEAHSLGIIHRDLKPANIMLNQKGIFVLDFGIAKMLRTDNKDSLSLSMTGNGFLVGTPFYMSPEQCLGQPVEARSDLYSLGALLYEMLAGRPPFDDEMLSAVIIKHATAEPRQLNELFSDIPPSVAAVVSRLLAKKPEDRPADAMQARALLEASINEQNSSQTNAVTQALPVKNESTQLVNNSTNADIATPSTQVSTIAAPASNHGRTIGIAAALGLIILAAIGGLLWFKFHSNPTIAADNSTKTNVGNTAVNAAMPMSHDMAMGNDFTTAPKSDDKTNAPSVPILSSEEADQVITKITQTTEHRADGMQIIKTPKDTALVCIHNMIDMGKTHMFAVERPNLSSPWEITARVSLDTPDFHGSNWTFEPSDVDGDGYEEVIFHGVNADNTALRCLIYVPRTRQNYVVTATKDASGKITNSTFSPNALTPNARAIHDALEKNVRAN